MHAGAAIRTNCWRKVLHSHLGIESPIQIRTWQYQRLDTQHPSQKHISISDGTLVPRCLVGRCFSGLLCSWFGQVEGLESGLSLAKDAEDMAHDSDGYPGFIVSCYEANGIQVRMASIHPHCTALSSYLFVCLLDLVGVLCTVCSFVILAIR